MPNANELWRIGDAGTTIFGPRRQDGRMPEIIASKVSKRYARLLRTAPELLEVLQAIHEFWANGDASLSPYATILDNDYSLRDAIAEVLESAGRMREAINLDCMPLEDIAAFTLLATKDRPQGLTIAEFKLLRRYADFKESAMRKRLAGDICAAMQLESTCERIYSELPKELQW